MEVSNLLSRLRRIEEFPFPVLQVESCDVQVTGPSYSPLFEKKMKRFSTREIRQALVGRGNLRILLSDKVKEWDPYDPNTFSFLKRTYEEEALLGWGRIKALFSGMTQEAALENTWSVIAHHPELTGFILRGIELENETPILTKAKKFKSKTKKIETKDFFESLFKKSKLGAVPDLLNCHGFESKTRIRWGLANRVKATSSYSELVRATAAVDGISVRDASELLREAVGHCVGRKIKKITRKIAIEFSDKQAEIFSEDPSLVPRIYGVSCTDGTAEILRLKNLRKKFNTDRKIFQAALVAIEQREWAAAGEIVLQISIDSTAKLAAANAVMNATSKDNAPSIGSFPTWKEMQPSALNFLRSLMPGKRFPNTWVLSSDQIAVNIKSGELREVDFSKDDIAQLTHSWDRGTQQSLIDSKKFFALTVDAAIWKVQGLSTLIEASASRITDGPDLLSKNVVGIPAPRDLLCAILEAKSPHASSLLQDCITLKLASVDRRNKNQNKPKNWAEYISIELGSELWKEGTRQSLIREATLAQILFLVESKSIDLDFDYFKSEVRRILPLSDALPAEFVARVVQWVEKEPSCAVYVGPSLGRGFIHQMVTLANAGTSIESIRVLYEYVQDEYKEPLWRLLIGRVLIASELIFLCIEGIRRDYKIEWNHCWNQVSGSVEDRSRALALVTRNDLSRLKKIRVHFTHEVFSSALFWGARQLPTKCKFDVVFMELMAAIGVRNAPTLLWILDQRNYKRASGDKLAHLYSQHQMLKKSGKTRTISVPVPGLKRIQKSILRNLLNPLGAHDAAYGFVLRRSIVDNARVHVGKALVASADVRNCFPSVRWPLVHASLKRDFMNKLSEKTISAIVDICTTNGGLPIGAPTSPALLNRVLLKTDEILSTQALRRGCSYSRYADDLTFSGDERVVGLLGISRSVLQKIGLELDPEKTNIFRRGRRQVCTGLVVNDKVNIPRKIRRKIRASVHSFETGTALHWDGQAVEKGSLRGRLEFLNMVSPHLASGLIERFNNRSSEDAVKSPKKLKHKG